MPMTDPYTKVQESPPKATRIIIKPLNSSGRSSASGSPDLDDDNQDRDYCIFLSHWEHVLYSGPKRWFILIMLTPDSDDVLLYQLHGTTDSYNYQPPTTIRLSETSKYIVRTRIGTVPESRLGEFQEIVSKTPITMFDMRWNSQNWMTHAIKRLKDAGFDIRASAHEEFLKELAETRPGESAIRISILSLALVTSSLSTRARVHPRVLLRSPRRHPPPERTS